MQTPQETDPLPKTKKKNPPHPALKDLPLKY